MAGDTRIGCGRFGQSGRGAVQAIVGNRAAFQAGRRIANVVGLKGEVNSSQQCRILSAGLPRNYCLNVCWAWGVNVQNAPSGQAGEQRHSRDTPTQRPGAPRSTTYLLSGLEAMLYHTGSDLIQNADVKCQFNLA